MRSVQVHASETSRPARPATLVQPVFPGFIVAYPEPGAVPAVDLPPAAQDTRTRWIVERIGLSRPSRRRRGPFDLRPRGRRVVAPLDFSHCGVH